MGQKGLRSLQALCPRPAGDSPRPWEACLGRGPASSRSLTWNLLCGLLPRLVGAAPALGQKGGRTTAEDKVHSLQARPHPLPTGVPPAPAPGSTKVSRSSQGTE